MTASAEPRPHYVTVPGGQLRLFRAGAGADLVVIAGPLMAAGVTARRLAESCAGWRVTAIELPGLGGSAHHDARDADSVETALAACIDALAPNAFALVAFDLAAPFLHGVTSRLAKAPAALFAVDAECARAFRKHGLFAPDLAPRTDGTQFAALWTFLRDRAAFESDDPTQIERKGDPLPAPADLAETHVAASTEPERFAALWRVALEACDALPPAGAVTLDALSDLPPALARLSLADGASVVPAARPGGAAIWHDEIDTARGRMHQRRSGDAGVPILVLPTGGGSSQQFEGVVAGLAAKRQAFSVDYIGNGLSEKRAEKVSIESLAEDMAALIDAMGFAQVDVWGSHTGANVGIELAARHPAKVRRLVAEGPVFITQAFQDDLLAKYFPSFEPDKWGVHAMRAFHWRRDMFLYWPWYDDRREASRRLGLPSPRALHDYTLGILESSATYAGAYAAAFRYDTRSRIPLVRAPTMVCAGPNDMLVNALEETRKLNLPNVTVQPTPTTVWWPDPEPQAAAATMDIYRAFLDS